MIVVDTSAWIDFFRDQNAPVADSVATLIADNRAALCGPILTEILRGIDSKQKRLRVIELLAGCHLLKQPPDLWTDAGLLGAQAMKRGMTIKTLDLLIAVHCIASDLPILTRDTDFFLLGKIGIPIRAVRSVSSR